MNRNTSNRIEQLFTSSGSNLSQLSSYAEGVLLLLRTVTESLTAPSRLWDSGVGAKILTTAEDEIPEESRWTRRWWLALQLALGLFQAFMATPMSTLVSLAIVDDAGVAVLDADGNVQRPFVSAVFPAVAGDLAVLTIEDLVYKEAEVISPFYVKPV